MRLGLPTTLVLLCALLAASCAQGGSPSLEPVPPQTVAVNATLRVPLVVNGGAGKSLAFRFEGPDLPRLSSTTSISGTGSGGEFRWTPLASHVGDHEIDFVLTSAGGKEIDRVSTVIQVEPADDAAPVFLRPGAGGTFDLTREPCVSFDVEVRDDDSERVEIRSREELPEGGTLRREGPKQARFEWCPSPDQVGASERWTVALEADDMDHEPVPHDYVIVLRTGDKEGCPGEAPMITVNSPEDGMPVESSSGWPVVVTVDDDMGLRDPPILLYTTARPDDVLEPDVTAFDQSLFERDGEQWRARVPSLGLEPGEEHEVFYVVSATDNDDASGTACDQRTDTPLRSFIARRTEGGDALADCEVCSASNECESGVCATAAGDDRCLPSCADGEGCSAGTCQDTSTAEGSIARACGDVAAACEGGGGEMCMDDSREDDDSIATATDAPSSGSVDGQICEDDDDYFRIGVTSGTQLDVSLGFSHSDGDLDLQLVGDDGTILDTSAGTTDMESVTHCADTARDLYAKVYGFFDAENDYSLSVSSSASDCCNDDAFEDDDTFGTARSVMSGDAVDGSICPGDDDWATFSVAGPSTVSVTITFAHDDGDLDLELYDPDRLVVASSRSTADIEEIEVDVSEAGTYAMRVYGYRDASGPYLGEVEVTEMSGCGSDFECPSDQICDGGTCVDRTCSSSSDCPTGYECPEAGPTMPPRLPPESECGTACSFNSDCRSAEACKRFPEGRYCGRDGSGQNGDACETFKDCGGQRACLTWTGGYCARAGCADNGDCESDTKCVSHDGMNVCARDCLTSSAICRMSEGYDCEPATDAEGSVQFVCLPGS